MYNNSEIKFKKIRRQRRVDTEEEKVLQLQR
jgi:hypothetical protein